MHLHFEASPILCCSVLFKSTVKYFCVCTAWQLQLQAAREISQESALASVWQVSRKSDFQWEETDPEVGGKQNWQLVHHMPL